MDRRGTRPTEVVRVAIVGSNPCRRRAQHSTILKCRLLHQSSVQTVIQPFISADSTPFISADSFPFISADSTPFLSALTIQVSHIPNLVTSTVYKCGGVTKWMSVPHSPQVWQALNQALLVSNTIKPCLV